METINEKPENEAMKESVNQQGVTMKLTEVPKALNLVAGEVGQESMISHLIITASNPRRGRS